MVRERGGERAGGVSLPLFFSLSLGPSLSLSLCLCLSLQRHRPEIAARWKFGAGCRNSPRRPPSEIAAGSGTEVCALSSPSQVSERRQEQDTRAARR